MYENATKLLISRDEDVQSDKRTLELLSNNHLSVPETWEQLSCLKNGAIRFDACQEFLQSQIGAGTLGQAGDVRVIFASDEGIKVAFPGDRSDDHRIFVTFDSICRLIEKPDHSAPVSSNERLIEDYLELLQKPHNIPSRVRLRVPDVCQDWSDWTCWMYYVFILHPKDLVQGKCQRMYWEHELERQKSLRTDREHSEKKDWAHQRLVVDKFKKCMYQNLLMFDMPIMFQIPSRMLIPIEELFSIAGC